MLFKQLFKNIKNLSAIYKLLMCGHLFNSAVLITNINSKKLCFHSFLRIRAKKGEMHLMHTKERHSHFKTISKHLCKKQEQIKI